MKLTSKLMGNGHISTEQLINRGKRLISYCSKQSDKAAARRFFKCEIKASGVPQRIVIDKSGANLAGLLRTNIGLKSSRDHRFIKKITRPTLGLKAFHSAAVTLAGIAAAHMIRKRQLHTNHSSPLKQFASLVA